MQGSLVVVSGFSGAGKGTVMKRLLEKYDNYALSVSATTRQPREGEQEGVSYFFKSPDAFSDMIAKGELIEYANYCGNFYGTPKSYVEQQLRAGKDVLLEIEVQGALKVKAQIPDAVLVFITPPSMSELEARLRGRQTETEAVIAKRMARAKEEAGIMEQYDYLVVNDALETCVDELHGLIQKQHDRISQQKAFIDKIRQELSIY